MNNIRQTPSRNYSNKWQFTKNLSVNVINFIVNVLLGLILTPFIISNLGLGLYGVIQIAISLSTYMGIISSSLNQANNRYISLYLTNNNNAAANSVITTTLLIYLFLFIFLLPVLIYFSLNASSIFNVQYIKVSSVTLLFIFITISFLLIMLTSVFVSPAYAKNRLDVVQLVNIVRNVLKLVLIVLLVLFVSKTPAIIGFSHLLAGIISLGLAVFFFFRYMPFYRFRFLDFKKEYVKDLISLSSWTLVNALGLLLFRQTDIIVVNLFLGADSSGRFAILVQIYSVLIHIATVFSVVFSPIIFLKYSQGKYDELKDLINRAIKFTGFLVAFASSLVIIFAKEILVFWVGSSYLDLVIYLQLMILPFTITQATRPLMALNTAYNRVKIPGLLNLLFGLLHIGTSIVFLRFTNIGFLAVVLSGLGFSVFSQVAALVYASYYLKESLTRMVKFILIPMLLQVVMILIGFTLKSFYSITTFFDFSLMVGLNIIIGLFFFYFCLISKADLKIVRSMIKR